MNETSQNPGAIPAAFPLNGIGILIHLEGCLATGTEILKNMESGPA
jgi:hypothetical protein